MQKAITILNTIENKVNLEKKVFIRIPLQDLFEFAITQFYPPDWLRVVPAQIKETPPEWNPVYIHYYREFDPYMRGLDDVDQRSEELFTPWEGVNGLERARVYAEEVKNQIDSSDYFKKSILSIEFPYECLDSLLFRRFIFTREKVSYNSIILGFYHIAAGTYERYLIKDLKKYCRILRKSDGDFVKILGSSKYPKRRFNIKSEEEKIKKSLPLIDNVTDTEIYNPCVAAMMDIFRANSNFTNVHQVNFRN